MNPDSALRVAVIGAGVSGLAAARTLQQAGHQVTVFEKEAVVGGRIRTRQIHINSSIQIAFDCGAQNLKSIGTALNDAAQRVLNNSDFAPIYAPVCLHDNKQILAGDAQSNAEPKWSCRDGMQRLPGALARDLDVRCGVAIERIEESDSGFSLYAKDEAALAETQRVVVTLPAPIAAELLQNSSWRNEDSAMPERAALLQNIQYSRCLCVMLNFAAQLDDASWYAILARDRSHPLLWLARENAKGFVPRKFGTVLVAQLGHEASCELWDESDEQITQRTCEWITEIIGSDFQNPVRAQVHHWRYSQPRNSVDFDAVNPTETRVIICGDATARGRVPDAYQSGLHAASRIINQAN